jgi:hypothetical protein
VSALSALAVLAAFVAVFGLLVWFASGIARVEEHRSEADHHMVNHIRRHYPEDSL